MIAAIENGVMTGVSYSSLTYEIIDFHGPNNLCVTGLVEEGVTPSKEELLAGKLKVRSYRYKNESDPLYQEWQYQLAIGDSRSDTYKQKWIDCVEKIKHEISI